MSSFLPNFSFSDFVNALTNPVSGILFIPHYLYNNRDMNHLRHINQKTIQLFNIPQLFEDDLRQMGNLPTNSTEHDVEVVDVSQFDKIYVKLEKRLKVRK